MSNRTARMIAMAKKIIKHITNPDEFMSAMNDAYSTPFGNVGQNVVYKVDKSVLDNAGKARNWEGWEIVANLQHAANHSRSRMDISDIPLNEVFPADYVKPGKWNNEQGKMEYPDYSVSGGGHRNVDLPDVPRGRWTYIFTLLAFGWLPLQWWIESKFWVVASDGMLCYPALFFFVMVGVSHLAYSLRSNG